jgi:hypothetical protein
MVVLSTGDVISGSLVSLNTSNVVRPVKKGGLKIGNNSGMVADSGKVSKPTYRKLGYLFQMELFPPLGVCL